MADQKISALPASTTPLAGTEVLPIVQSGVTKQVSVADLTAERDVAMRTATASQSVAGGVDLYTLENTNSTAVSTKYAGIRFRGRDTVSGAKDSVYTRSYPVDQDYVNSYYSIWTRTSDVVTEKVRVNSTGNVVFVNSGNGIDFSATAGTGTSELLADYEEGTWTPGQGDFTVVGTFTSSGTYTKVGRSVTAIAVVSGSTSIAGNAGQQITGLPFVPARSSAGSCVYGNRGGGGFTQAFTNNSIFSAGTGTSTSGLIITVTYEV